MEANLPVSERLDPPAPKDAFPYANWGPGAALFGVLMALVTGLLLSIPVFVIDSPDGDDLSSAASVLVQFATVLGFLIVPLVIAGRNGTKILTALRNLGLRAFEPLNSLLLMATAAGGYLFFAYVYVVVVGEPQQEDIAEDFGALPFQILLIVFAAAISEEVCFRGMLFGGLRQRFPRIWAALISAVVFGALHAVTGISAVPPLIAFGFILALLYEETGSIIPGILLHMLNNSVALLAS
ncbi:MAG TPA: type II CAAX endopeptidase family protein [Solirubrobacterales bacterium]|jgi:membrane protease YdiL (CAAX protease family)